MEIGVKETLKAGDVFFIPNGAVHNATNVGITSATIIGNYIVEKGKPLATPVKQPASRPPVGQKRKRTPTVGRRGIAWSRTSTMFGRSEVAS